MFSSMNEEQTTFDQVKSLLKEAYDAFREFMQGLSEIKREEQQIIAEAHERTDAKKMSIIKSKIQNL